MHYFFLSEEVTLGLNLILALWRFAGGSLFTKMSNRSQLLKVDFLAKFILQNFGNF
jgi:hypothetical protein